MDSAIHDLAALRLVREKLTTAMAEMVLAAAAARRVGCDWLADEMEACRTEHSSGTAYTVLRAMDECLAEQVEVKIG